MENEKGSDRENVHLNGLTVCQSPALYVDTLVCRITFGLDTVRPSLVVGDRTVWAKP